MNKDTILEHLYVISWNANSLFPKREEFADFLAEYNVDVALVEETFLRPHTNYTIPNYTIYRNDRADRGGGTAILIKSHIKHKEIQTTTQGYIENTATQVYTKDGLLNIISLYNSPTNILHKDTLRHYRGVYC